MGLSSFYPSSSALRASLVLVLLLISAGIAFADECDRLIAQEKTISAREKKLDDAHSREQDEISRQHRKAKYPSYQYFDALARGYESSCADYKRKFPELQARISRRGHLEKVCGKRVNQNCDSKCWVNWIARAKSDIESTCATATKYRTKYAAEALAKEQGKPIASQQEQSSKNTAGAPEATSGTKSGSTKCSTITGGILGSSGGPCPDEKKDSNLAGPKRSVSCSTITDGKNPAGAKHCEQAFTILRGARATRTSHPHAAQESYKKAAKAFAEAGDTVRERWALEEAKSPTLKADLAPLPKQPGSQADTHKRDGDTYSRLAQIIEKEDPSCAGLTKAAENYLLAGKAYQRTGNSRDDARINQLLKRRDELIKEVDRRKAANKCTPSNNTNKPSANLHSGDSKKPSPEKCEAAFKQLDQLSTRLAEMDRAASVGQSKRSQAARDVAITIQLTQMELNARGCSKAGAKPPNSLACKQADIHWRLYKTFPAEEIKTRLKQAGC